MIDGLEALAMSAWPPADLVPYDGWLLCDSGGYTRRTNSVQPLKAGALELAEKIAHCEAFYAERGRHAVFRLTAASAPAHLEPELERRGYRLSDPTSVQLLDLRSRRACSGPAAQVRFEFGCEEAWLAACMRLNRISPKDGPAFRGILERASGDGQRCAFVSISGAGRARAIGLGVLIASTLFLSSIATAEADRRRGLARDLVESLLAWASAQGAEQALLQVVVANAPGQALYRHLGFAEVYRYWYREATAG